MAPSETENNTTSSYAQKTTLQRPGKLGIDYDELGAEMAPNARVWHKYVEESDRMDKELVDGWNKTLDVILLFATLFSAISTATEPHASVYHSFVLESSKDLKLDFAEKSAETLLVVSQTLLAISAGSSTNTSTLVPTGPSAFTPKTTAVVVNTLWFTSLSLSVAVALVSILAKEWCYSFMVGRVGPVLVQGRLRQQRWEGIKRWKLKEILSVLPLLMHAALLLFAIGLCVYLWDINRGVAMPVIVITLSAALFYIVTVLLSLVIRFCPYSSTIARLIHPFWIASFDSPYTRNFLSALITLPLGFFGILNKVKRTRMSRLFCRKREIQTAQHGSESPGFISRYFQQARGIINRLVAHIQEALSMEKSELVGVETPMDTVTSSMLSWMITNCEDSRSVDLALQSLAGADLLLLPRWPLWQCNAVWLVVQRLRSCLDAVKNPWASGRGVEQQRLLEACSLYSRSLKFLINFIRGEGLTQDISSSYSSPSQEGFQFVLTSRHSPPESLSHELKASLIHVLRSSHFIIERCLDQSLGRADLAAFEFDQLLFTNAGAHFENFIRGPLEQSHRKWGLLRRLLSGRGEVTIPPAALLALIQGITKSYIYEPYQRPFLLVDLLKMLPPDAHALRHAVGVCLTVVTFRRCNFPSGESDTSHTPGDTGYRQYRAKQAYLAISSKTPGPHETRIWLKFGLLGLLASENPVFHPCEDEINPIGHVPRTLTGVHQYEGIVPTLPPHVDAGSQVNQIISGWMDTDCFRSSDNIPQLTCLITHAISFHGACKILGTQVIEPLVQLFLNTSSPPLKKLCLLGLRYLAGLSEIRMGEPYTPYFEEHPMESALVCQQLGHNGFLERLFQSTKAGNEDPTIIPHVMCFLWCIAALILHYRSRVRDLAPQLLSILSSVCDMRTELADVSGICEMGFTDLWIANLENMSLNDPHNLSDSRLLEEMTFSYRRAPDMRPSPNLFSTTLAHYNSPAALSSRTSISHPSWLCVLQELKQRCKENMVELNKARRHNPPECKGENLASEEANA